eukprot:6245659-Pyramimonas_sp.AAC.1
MTVVNFIEAPGVHKRARYGRARIDRVLSRTHVSMPHGGLRRIDTVAPCLMVANGLPFNGETMISLISGNGAARLGTNSRRPLT